MYHKGSVWLVKYMTIEIREIAEEINLDIHVIH